MKIRISSQGIPSSFRVNKVKKVNKHSQAMRCTHLLSSYCSPTSSWSPQVQDQEKNTFELLRSITDSLLTTRLVITKRLVSDRHKTFEGLGRRQKRRKRKGLLLNCASRCCGLVCSVKATKKFWKFAYFTPEPHAK